MSVLTSARPPARSPVIAVVVRALQEPVRAAPRAPACGLFGRTGTCAASALSPRALAIEPYVTREVCQPSRPTALPSLIEPPGARVPQVMTLIPGAVTPM